MAGLARLSSVVFACVVAVFVFSLGGCSKAENPWDKIEGGKTKVLVSFSPLYCFTKAVSGNDAKVQTLLSSTGPHGYEGQGSDAKIALGADLFLVNGLTLDEFVTKIANSSGNKKLTIVKVAEKALPKPDKDDKKPLLLKMGADHDHGPGHEGHDHGEWDPHVWLGIEQATLMVQTIRDSLKSADAANAAAYDRRTDEYVAKLKELQDYGKKALADKKNRKIIAMHDSLGYFCKSFDLQLVDSIMPRAGVEADNKKLAELVENCKKQDIRILAVEPQYSKEKATILRDNLSKGGHTLAIVEIDPLETGPRDQLSADYYLQVMRRNIDNLAKEMQ